MVNKNILGLRSLALRVFSELIHHCRHTAVVDEQIELTRLVLQRICLDYIDGLTKLYITLKDDEVSQEDRNNILNTIQNFSSIA
jgi:hypothetical protein